MLTRFGFGFYSQAGDGVSVVPLGVTAQCHECAKQGDMPQVGESHCSASVDAEYFDAGKGCDDADPEAEHVRQGGDRDGNGGVLERLRHSLGNWVGNGRPAPGPQHHEGVVDSDSWIIKIVLFSVSQASSGQFFSPYPA